MFVRKGGGGDGRLVTGLKMGIKEKNRIEDKRIKLEKAPLQ